MPRETHRADAGIRRVNWEIAWGEREERANIHTTRGNARVWVVQGGGRRRGCALGAGRP
jgi:hypothetical protein